MSACKLGTVPVNRLTNRQCIKLLHNAFNHAEVCLVLGADERAKLYVAMAFRIKRYQRYLKGIS